MVLPPCHYGFQMYTTELTSDERKKLWTKTIGKSIHYASNFTDEDLDKKGVPSRKLSLMWNQRSVDVPLGLPFNIASYGLLLHILAKMTNMVPERLIGNLGDCHIYNNQLKQAEEMIDKATDWNTYHYNLPELQISDTVNFNGTIDDMLQSCTWEDFKLPNYENNGKIEFELNN